MPRHDDGMDAIIAEMQSRAYVGVRGLAMLDRASHPWWQFRPPEPLLSPPLLVTAIAACKERLLDTTRPVDVRLEAVDALTFLEQQRGLGHYASEALTMEKIQQVFMMCKREVDDGGR